ncbi:hypothetical protein KAJ27_08455 [bacterium]|nr:hypothetical protein [bacterium]
MYITNKPDIADYALKSGANRIILDLEIRGKESRQGSKTQRPHNLADFKKLRESITNGFLSARINPIAYPETENEITFLIDSGVNQIILPYFRSIAEVERFLTLINGKTQTCLLVETMDSLSLIDKLVKFNEVDEFYLGLNDLSLDLKLNFPFTVLSKGIINEAIRLLDSLEKKFGFGGLAPAGSGLVIGKKILAELVHQKASTVFLSRAFHKCATSVEELQKDIDLKKEIQYIRKLETAFMERTKVQEIKDMVNTYRLIDSI